MRIVLWVSLAAVLAVAAVGVFNAFALAPQPRASVASPVEAGIDANVIAQHLAASVRFRTISHQDPAQDDHGVFAAFRDFLAQTYPRAHAALARDLVNGDGLVYEWKGSDPALPPILLLAHQDVVPVEPGTEARWTHPPFDGVIADGFVWGRGAIDDKGSLICLFEAIESLLAEGFRPARSVWLASGFDEEVGGMQGGKKIAERFAQRNLRFAWVVDEGGGVTDGVVPDVPRQVATISVSEKGYLSLELLAKGQGGHSSMPPKESAVRALTTALRALDEQPFPAHLNPVLRGNLQRLAAEKPFLQRLVSANLWLTAPWMVRAYAREERLSPQVRTTIAPTILEAGIKDNVVPSTARAVVNFRIIPGETVASVRAHVQSVAGSEQVEVRKLTRMESEPSPVSRVEGSGFAQLEAMVHAFFPDAVVVPGVVNGATDVRHFAAVSEDQYRFVPRLSRPEDMKRVHGTDERASVPGLAVTVSAYRKLLRGSASAAGTPTAAR